jgi:hypothetical protein
MTLGKHRFNARRCGSDRLGDFYLENSSAGFFRDVWILVFIDASFAILVKLVLYL